MANTSTLQKDSGTHLSGRKKRSDPYNTHVLVYDYVNSLTFHIMYKPICWVSTRWHPCTDNIKISWTFTLSVFEKCDCSFRWVGFGRLCCTSVCLCSPCCPALRGTWSGSGRLFLRCSLAVWTPLLPVMRCASAPEGCGTKHSTWDKLVLQSEWVVLFTSIAVQVYLYLSHRIVSKDHLS